MIETVYHIPGAPRMAILADLHGRDYEEIIASVRAHEPEIVAVVGDVIYGSLPEDDVSPLKSQANVMPFLRACVEIAPTFLSLGNHEWPLDNEDIGEIKAAGVTILDNEYVKIEISDRQIVLGGLTSAHVTDYRRFLNTLQPQEHDNSRYPKRGSMMIKEGLRVAPEKEERTKHMPMISWLSGFGAVPGYHILLSHHPEYYCFVPANVELMISGHAHGGQWRLFGRGVFAPGQGLFPKYSRGVYEKGRLVVSAGLANTASLPRLFNPTEVVYLE